MKDNLLKRFLRYTAVDTQSRFGAGKIPSTDKQFNLARMLRDELEVLGLHDVRLDENCYLTATLPANTSREIPPIGFIAHLDTSPDSSGAGVRPQIWENYDGGTLVLNPEKGIEISPDEFPDLKKYKGQTLITTDGTTLLGADDKAGVAEIVTAMEYLLAHPEIGHGTVRVGFTPDEEVGSGTDLFDVDAFGCRWAYTVDGGPLGELEYENFNAASAVIEIKGRSVHPGYAKGKMVNASLVAANFIAAMPAGETPETTEGYEGFYHLTGIHSTVENARLEYIIRDHDRTKFERRKDFIRNMAKEIQSGHPGCVVAASVTDQYYNMREKLEISMHVVDIARRAMEQCGIIPVVKPIRGGTDGARLSFMGLPCPNLFAGGENFHGPYEYASLRTMEKAVQVIVEIVRETTRRPS